MQDGCFYLKTFGAGPTADSVLKLIGLMTWREAEALAGHFEAARRLCGDDGPVDGECLLSAVSTREDELSEEAEKSE